MPRKENHQSITTVEKQPQESFADVARACHRWLMERDEFYRRNRQHYEAGRDARNAKNLRTKPELP